MWHVKIPPVRIDIINLRKQKIGFSDAQHVWNLQDPNQAPPSQPLFAIPVVLDDDGKGD